MYNEPASSLPATRRARDRSFVDTPTASPNDVLLALLITSSYLLNAITDMTLPDTHSLVIDMSWVQLDKMHDEMYQPSASSTLGVTLSPTSNCGSLFYGAMDVIRYFRVVLMTDGGTDCGIIVICITIFFVFSINFFQISLNFFKISLNTFSSTNTCVPFEHICPWFVKFAIIAPLTALSKLAS